MLLISLLQILVGYHEYHISPRITYHNIPLLTFQYSNITFYYHILFSLGLGIYRKVVGKNSETYNGEFKNNQYYGRGVLRATGELTEDKRQKTYILFLSSHFLYPHYDRGVLFATGEPTEDGIWRNNALKIKNPRSEDKQRRR